MSHRVSALSQSLCMKNSERLVVNTKFWIALKGQAWFGVDNPAGLL